MTGELLTKCSVCGMELYFPAEKNVVRCGYCDRMNDRPKSSPEKTGSMKLANELRNMGEFAKAQDRYLDVLADNFEEHEARWGLLLCKYGVMYVEDNSANRKERLVTCRRSVSSSFQDEEYYQIVLNQASPDVRDAYEKDAAYIDRIQGEIRQLRTQTEPYDVFLCYKETATEGGQTEDSAIAHGIFNELSRSGYRVFFAPESLKEKAGANYEAAIFVAIETSRVMLVLGTKKEYFESTWVRSEWRRFLERIDLGDEDKTLIPLFCHAADLPDTFKRRMIQGYDITKPFLENVKSRVDELLHREDGGFNLAKIYLGRGDFQKADQTLDHLLLNQPKNPHIWLYKAMISLQIQEESDLCRLDQPLSENKDFQTALAYASGFLKKQLEGYLKENERLIQATIETRETERTAKKKEAPSTATLKAVEKTQKPKNTLQRRNLTTRKKPEQQKQWRKLQKQK